MKLRGTLTEQAYREELKNSKYYLFNDSSMRRFLDIIRRTFPAMKTAHILFWTPEQGEDIISFLVDTDTVIKIELDRSDEAIEPIVDVYPIEFYLKGLSKINQIKIAVALDLAKNDNYTH
ncbi:hypothetical protein [Paenibacillus sp. DMB20]|uniref:hypothetical protein n=1 Tax=Paenibacillus sp. DMB20 TaxID=1642570 RepID=UPI0006276514|nr:hypothetical protein [Paenibacillus sp. DMB20]KKO51628.1 hypothetical protein XI25_24635 [Paenibacillus sp. DMB20]